MISRGPTLQFIKGETEFSLDGIGAGLLEVLNILTHIISEENKIFLIDEPEIHLHPHGQRILKNLLRKSAKKNQIIYITHSSDFVDLQEINRISVVRNENGKSKIFRSNLDYESNDWLKQLLFKLTKTEQKEFFFARKVLLVEGETEIGHSQSLLKN